MANGVNVKMGVSGVSQFKQSMKQAQQSVKTLDAQLALNEKQYKASGDAESYMTMKAELLKTKLEQQKSVVANAEKALDDMAKNGVDRSSKAYQDLYREMIKAKGELLDTQTAMNGVASAGEYAANEVSGMNHQLEHIGKGIDFQNVTSGIGSITSGLENAAKKAIQLGRKMVDAMLSAGSYADDLKTRAAKYELSTEDLQRMDKTASQIDTDVDTIITAQAKLKKGVGSADKGVMGAFAVLMGKGYNPKDKGWETAFWDAGEALMKFTNEEEKEVYAQKLFGKSWKELIPLFQAGRKEYEEMNASWTVLSEEQVNNLGKMDDEYQKLQANVETLKLSLLSEFAEPMDSLMTTINEKVAEFSEWLKSDDGKAVVDSVVGKVKEALEWISKPENIQGAIDALKGIMAGWGLLKLTGGALSALQLINGLKGLTGGGGGGAGGTGTGAATGAASGGAVAGASNAVTGAAAKAGAAITRHAAQFTPVAFGVDRFMNETNAGRALRDGTDILEGISKDLSDKAEEIKKNAETFEDDWNDVFENNPVIKFFRQGAENSGKASEWTLGDDVTAEEAMAFVQSMSDAADKMEKVAEETGGSTGGSEKVNTLTPADISKLTGMPLAVAEAVARVGFKIYIDGQPIYAAVDAYLGDKLQGQ